MNPKGPAKTPDIIDSSVEDLAKRLPGLALIALRQEPGFNNEYARLCAIGELSIRRLLEEEGVNVKLKIRQRIEEILEKNLEGKTREEILSLVRAELTKMNPVLEDIRIILLDLGVISPQLYLWT